MSNSRSASQGNAVLESTGTIDLVTRAAKDGAADAKEAATKFWNGTSLFLCRFVYTTSYTISYGVVFPSILISRSIPTNSSFVRGLVDGAHAATEKVSEMRGRKSTALAASRV